MSIIEPANFTILGKEIQEVIAAGAHVIHFDVMDNHYVPNLSIGPVVLQSLRNSGFKIPIDIHLMAKPIDNAAQPSGIPTLGNYIGTIRNWSTWQKSYNSVYCIADLHALTKRQTPKLLLKHSLDLLSVYLSCDINPKDSIIFMQSHISEHAQLCWILSCYSYFGELRRMVQFKEKSKNSKSINMGLFSYPILMTSDILLYQSHKVPAGLDQAQHVELSKLIAKRFNKIY
uniref:tryptophan--tRNA ligase n=1 Tax=Glossina pallidipes TaxID=7398 RepID=A0A1A9Z0Y8_GLOPL